MSHSETDEGSEIRQGSEPSEMARRLLGGELEVVGERRV